MAALYLRKGFEQIKIAVHLQRCHASFGSAKKPSQVKTLKAVGESIAAKGFLRPHKPYTPPNNVTELVWEIATKFQMAKGSANQQLTDMDKKFEFLAACFQAFKHGVPNSQIHEISSVGDVIAFYQQPVDTTVPLDTLKKMDLPENLHIQYEYLRFHPDTDTKFNGQTAFPKSSTLVTGLKYRGKYQGHQAKRSWP